MSYPSVIIDSGGGERIKVYSDGSLVETGKLNFSTDFDVVYDSGTGQIDVSLAGGGGAAEADEIDVYEGGVQVGAVSRKLNFDSSDFNVTENAGANSFDVEVNFPSLTNYVQLLDREVNQTIASSSAENTIFTHTIPANLLETTRGLRFELHFDALANSGSPTLTIKIKLGATTLWTGVTASFGANSERLPGFLIFSLANLSAANSQAGSGFMYLNNESTTGVSAGFGSIDDDEATTGVGAFSGSSAIDTTADRDFVVTIQWSVNHANVQFKKFIGTLELL